MFQTVLTFRPRMLSVFPPQKKKWIEFCFFTDSQEKYKDLFCQLQMCSIFSLHQRFWITLNKRQRLFIPNGEVLTHYDDKAFHPFAKTKKKRSKCYPQKCNITSSVLCWMFTEQHWKSLKCQIVISSCVRPPTNKWFIFLSTDTSKN